MADILTQRLKCNSAPDRLSKPELILELWRGRAARVEVGLFTGAAVMTISNISSVTLRVRSTREDLTGDSLMSQTVNSLTLITAPQWLAGSHETAAFVFTGAETNLTLDGIRKEFWLTVTALLSTGETVVCGAGKCVIYEDNSEAVGDPPVNPDAALSVAAADARYVRYDAAQSLTEGQQTQAKENINAGAGGGGSSAWNDITGKPAALCLATVSSDGLYMEFKTLAGVLIGRSLLIA